MIGLPPRLCLGSFSPFTKDRLHTLLGYGYREDRKNITADISPLRINSACVSCFTLPLVASSSFHPLFNRVKNL